MSPKEDEEDEEDEEANASCDPVTTPPASCAMTIPAHTSHAQHPISLKKRLVQSHNILKRWREVATARQHTNKYLTRPAQPSRN